MSTVGPGSILNETYELVELLGRGGMGVVWKARHLRLPKEVALKLLTPTAQASEVVVARFRREAEIASRLGHPHIVDVLDFNVLPDGAAYIVMELLKGEDLRRRLTRGPLPAEEALAILLQVASALQAAHEAGVVHRDLKPENIFLTLRPGALAPELCAKVLDFGISKIQGAQTLLTQDDVMVGTPAYMSPEQAAGKSAEVDGRADLFALATIAYEMLSGRCPFSGRSLAEVVHKVVFEEAPPLRQITPTLPEQVSQAIQRGMAKKPEQRFEHVAAFISAVMGRDAQTLPPAAARASAALPAPMAETLPGAAPEAASAAGLAATLPQGVVAPPTLSGEARPGAAGRRALLIFLLLAGLIAAGSAAWLLGRGGTSQPGTKKLAAAGTAKAGPVSRPAVSAQSRPAPVVPVRAVALEAGAARPARQQGGRQRPVRPTRGLPAEVATDLVEARAAVQKCDWERASQLALRSLRARETAEAYALLAMAYCCKPDIGSANSMLRNARGRTRAAAVAFCRKRGQMVQP